MKSIDSKLLKSISAQVLKERFGSTSHIYFNIKKDLEFLWEEVKDELRVKANVNDWANAITTVYGYEPGISLFLEHIYLNILAKIIVYLKFTHNTPNKGEIIEVINGKYFITKGITNFLEDDFSLWLLNSKIEDRSFTLFWTLCEELANYNFSKIDEDIFKELYEEIIEREERHKAGEYFTPEWLVQLILKEVILLWEQKKGKVIPKILDPACGSGTFLYHAIKILREKQTSMRDIVKNVEGIDINPIAAMITKVNYLMAIGDIIENSNEITLPIYIKDSLKTPDLFDNVWEIEKYDIIVGNPPWVVMRSIKGKDYQNFLKEEILKYSLLDNKDVHLFTQIELATLFFCKCADLYLKRDGIIAFVMPRSVIAGTIHHTNFRKFKNPTIKLGKIIDLEGVTPLFNMPACVLIGLKEGTTKYPVLLEKYTGKLPDRNIKFLEAKARLATEIRRYNPPDFSVEPSYYYNKFKVGASIFPRSLYFVDIISYKNSQITVKTSSDICKIVKDPWKIVLEGNIEDEFLYTTLLAWEIVPFGYIKLRLVVLPIREYLSGYKLLKVDELQREGFTGIAEWFKETQGIWHKRRTKKSEKRFPSLLDRLNYNDLLAVQNPSKRYVVLYNATGTNLVSCVIDKKSLPYFVVNEKQLKPKGLIIDVKTWFFETENEMEAFYLSAIFNSEIISEMIKPLQPRGLFGARAIHRRPLLFGIPKFDDKNYLHIELANIGKEAHKRMKSIRFAQKNNSRAEVRRKFKEEITRINQIVTELKIMTVN